MTMFFFVLFFSNEARNRYSVIKNFVGVRFLLVPSHPETELSR